MTIDKIMKMLWEVSGFRADATQADALQVLLETYTAQQALAYGDAPSQLIESLLNSLDHQASQLLDTGGRMRLSPEGQLDARDQPIALAADVKVVDRRIGQLHSAIGELTQAMLAMSEQLTDNEKKHARRQETLNTTLDMVGNDLRKLREERQAATTAAEALTTTVLESLASRGQVEELADQVTRMRQVLSDAMQSPRPQPPRPQPPYGAVLPPDAEREHRERRALAKATAISEEQLATWLNDPALAGWERDLMERELAERLTMRPPAFEPALDVETVASLKADAAAGKIPTRKLRPRLEPGAARKVNASREAVPIGYRDGKPLFPGCFLNTDGTITCRVCGLAKMPSEDPKASAYYKDRRALTGFKSDCKDCEKKMKAAKAAA